MKFMVFSGFALNFVQALWISSLFAILPPKLERMYLVRVFMVDIYITTFKNVYGCYMNENLVWAW